MSSPPHTPDADGDWETEGSSSSSLQQHEEEEQMTEDDLIAELQALIDPLDAVHETALDCLSKRAEYDLAGRVFAPQQRARQRRLEAAAENLDLAKREVEALRERAEELFEYLAFLDESRSQTQTRFQENSNAAASSSNPEADEHRGADADADADAATIDAAVSAIRDRLADIELVQLQIERQRLAEMMGMARHVDVEVARSKLDARDIGDEKAREGLLDALEKLSSAAVDMQTAYDRYGAERACAIDARLTHLSHEQQNKHKKKATTAGEEQKRGMGWVGVTLDSGEITMMDRDAYFAEQARKAKLANEAAKAHTTTTTPAADQQQQEYVKSRVNRPWNNMVPDNDDVDVDVDVDDDDSDMSSLDLDLTGDSLDSYYKGIFTSSPTGRGPESPCSVTTPIPYTPTRPKQQLGRESKHQSPLSAASYSDLDLDLDLDLDPSLQLLPSTPDKNSADFVENTKINEAAFRFGVKKPGQRNLITRFDMDMDNSSSSSARPSLESIACWLGLDNDITCAGLMANHWIQGPFFEYKRAKDDAAAAAAAAANSSSSSDAGSGADDGDGDSDDDDDVFGIHSATSLTTKRRDPARFGRLLPLATCTLEQLRTYQKGDGGDGDGGALEAYFFPTAAADKKRESDGEDTEQQQQQRQKGEKGEEEEEEGLDYDAAVFARQVVDYLEGSTCTDVAWKSNKDPEPDSDIPAEEGSEVVRYRFAVALQMLWFFEHAFLE